MLSPTCSPYLLEMDKKHSPKLNRSILTISKLKQDPLEETPFLAFKNTYRATEGT